MFENNYYDYRQTVRDQYWCRKFLQRTSRTTFPEPIIFGKIIDNKCIGNILYTN